jgi:hypothetical protein
MQQRKRKWSTWQTQVSQASGGSQSDFGSARELYGGRRSLRMRFVPFMGINVEGKGALDRGQAAPQAVEWAARQGKFLPSFGPPEAQTIIMGGGSSQMLRDFMQKYGMQPSVMGELSDDELRVIVREKFRGADDEKLGRILPYGVFAGEMGPHHVAGAEVTRRHNDLIGRLDALVQQGVMSEQNANLWRQEDRDFKADMMHHIEEIRMNGVKLEADDKRDLTAGMNAINAAIKSGKPPADYYATVLALLGEIAARGGGGGGPPGGGGGPPPKGGGGSGWLSGFFGGGTGGGTGGAGGPPSAPGSDLGGNASGQRNPATTSSLGSLGGPSGYGHSTGQPRSQSQHDLAGRAAREQPPPSTSPPLSAAAASGQQTPGGSGISAEPRSTNLDSSSSSSMTSSSTSSSSSSAFGGSGGGGAGGAGGQGPPGGGGGGGKEEEAQGTSSQPVRRQWNPSSFYRVGKQADAPVDRIAVTRGLERYQGNVNRYNRYIEQRTKTGTPPASIDVGRLKLDIRKQEAALDIPKPGVIKTGLGSTRTNPMWPKGPVRFYSEREIQAMRAERTRNEGYWRKKN